MKPEPPGTKPGNPIERAGPPTPSESKGSGADRSDLCLFPRNSQAPPVRRRRTALATLDLSKPGHVWAVGFLRRVSTGRDPMWRLFGLRRDGDVLKLAVRWICNGQHSVVSLSLVDEGMRWKDFPSEGAVRRELVRLSHIPELTGIAVCDLRGG